MSGRPSVKRAGDGSAVAKNSLRVRSLRDAEIKEKAAPRRKGGPETSDEAIARGVSFERIPAPVVPMVGYPRPNFRKGKGSEG